jgi:hypothetical protein
MLAAEAAVARSRPARGDELAPTRGVPRELAARRAAPRAQLQALDVEGLYRAR